METAEPCLECRAGRPICSGGMCGCIADHPDDDRIMRSFKIMKRRLDPARAARDEALHGQR